MVGCKDGWMEMKEEWQQQRRRQILPPHEDAGEQMESNRRQKKMKQMKVWPCGSAGPGFCWSGSYCPRVERASFPIMRQPAFFFYPWGTAEQSWHFICRQSSHITAAANPLLLQPPPPQTLADDRGAMQPADWPMEPPVRADLERRRKRHKRLRTESIMISSLGLCDWVSLINGYMMLHRTQ